MNAYTSKAADVENTLVHECRLLMDIETLFRMCITREKFISEQREIF